MTDPIRKSVIVLLAPKEAFTLFTREIDRWWPKDSHSISARQGQAGVATVQIEPKKGGQVIETLPDGTRALWGQITEWHPGERLSMDWHVGQNKENAIQIRVTFSPCDAGTRVDLTHSGWETHGDQATMMSAEYSSGWNKVLGQCFASAATRFVVSLV